MSVHDLMKDPYFAQLMYVIEQAICMGDTAAEQKGVRLTDSNIKSALNKARNMAADMVITPVERLETREDFIMELALSIAANRKVILEEEDGPEGPIQAEVSQDDWRKAILAVEASLKVRRSTEPGSRYYLDYVHQFIEQRRV